MSLLSELLQFDLMKRYIDMNCQYLSEFITIVWRIMYHYSLALHLIP